MRKLRRVRWCIEQPSHSRRCAQAAAKANKHHIVLDPHGGDTGRDTAQQLPGISRTTSRPVTRRKPTPQLVVHRLLGYAEKSGHGSKIPAIFNVNDSKATKSKNGQTKLRVAAPQALTTPSKRHLSAPNLVVKFRASRHLGGTRFGDASRRASGTIAEQPGKADDRSGRSREGRDPICADAACMGTASEAASPPFKRTAFQRRNARHQHPVCWSALDLVVEPLTGNVRTVCDAKNMTQCALKKAPPFVCNHRAHFEQRIDTAYTPRQLALGKRAQRSVINRAAYRPGKEDNFDAADR